MDSWKAEVRRVRREKIRRKKMQMREKVGKSRFTVFFQWFVAPEGRKVGSLKRRVRSQLARWEMKKCTPLWREAHLQVKMYKTHQCRTTVGRCDVEKVHAVVARSTFASQNVQNTPAPDHFWKLRCGKSARRCGAKHISKSKVLKTDGIGPLLDVAMSKKYTPLWREAHFEVKMLKTPGVRTTFGGSDVEFRKSARRCGAKHISKSKCTKHQGFGPLLEAQMSSFEKVHAVVARSTFRSQNVQNTRGSDRFWRFRCCFASLDYTTLHFTTLHYTTLHYITLHYISQHYRLQLQLHNYSPLHSTTLHYTKLHYITLHYTPLHSTTLHYTTLHSTTLHYTTTTTTQLHSTTLQLHHYTARHSTTLQYTTTTATTTQLHSTTLHYTTLRSTTQQIQLHLRNYTPLHSTTLHCLTLHCTPLHYTTLHSTTLQLKLHNYTPLR